MQQIEDLDNLLLPRQAAGTSDEQTPLGDSMQVRIDAVPSFISNQCGSNIFVLGGLVGWSGMSIKPGAPH